MKPDNGQGPFGKRDNGAPCMSTQSTGMAWSILTEIRQLLNALNETGKAGAIDLRSLPMTDADREQLEEILGQGEVRAELNLAGASEVRETAYAGVWWIRHKGAGDRIACEEIAVTPIPEILITHPADIEAAAARLEHELSQGPAAADLREQDQENELETSNV
jgi:hydrogenase-1 operon protein HyaF